MRDRGCPSGQSIANPQKSAIAGVQVRLRHVFGLNKCGPSRMLDSKFLKAVARKEIKQGTSFTANTELAPQFLSGAVQFKKNGTQKEIPVGVGTNSIDWVPFTLNNQSRSAGKGRN